ncbi:GNAT family N-acetyltransferase [uncultured Gilvimarinus sp.]|uniref:GNAT family N-acetyltransferase n=1 Tax=uncultured Gilvimarinus sp. TaxID=1689143 RepID=UPI0030EDC8C6|tara:strand:- start:290 stop:751 length:462 start_codon:yes stop_codon:yes gene_type:complete
MKEFSFDILDLKNDEDVLEAATLHCGVPGEWNSDHSYSEESVVRAVEDLQNSVHACYVVLARNEKNKLVGMHWVKLESRCDEKFGNVASLWVHPNYRRQGVATQLKELAETWLRDHGATEIRTQVYMENRKMRALNEKLGYKVKLVGMAKSIQ